MKFLKLFPVALAAFALASCSDNELFDGKTAEQQMDPNKLYAQIEDLTDGETGDITRAGFAYSYEAAKPNGQVFVWTKDDQVKLYDDNGNWRPQIWTYDEAATIQYSSTQGFAVFTTNSTNTAYEGAVKTVGTTVADQYTSAYGVMPYTLAEFANEKRTAIKFDFSKLAYYETGLDDATSATTYTSAKLSKAPIPLWAVAKNNVMNVNYLTGILKVDIDNIENTLGAVDAVANTHQFLIIQAEDAANAGKGFYMHPTSANVAGLAAVNFKPDGKADGTPYVPTVASAGTGAAKTDLTATAMATTNSTAIPSDLIVVDLGNCTGRVQVSVPLMPGAQKVKAYVKKDVSVANMASLDLQNPTAIIGEAKEWTVAAGKYYRIQDPGLVKISTLNNPYSVAQYIKTQDPLQTRDWTLQLDADVDVKTGGAGADPNNFTLDLSGVTLKHNVTITFGAGYGFKQNAAGDYLVVKTAASANDKYKLTINNNNNSTLQIITVDAANAGPVVLTGDYKTATKTININGPKVTLMDADLSDAASVVNAKAPFTIDCDPTVLTTTKKVNIATGCTKVSLLNGTINGITLDATNKIAANVEIYSEGLAKIDAFSYQNMPFTTTAGVDTYTYDINFTSKWTATLAAESFTDITDHDGAVVADKFIVTAAQLAKFSGANAADVILLGSFDLNGSSMSAAGNDWPSIAFTSGKNFIGYDKKAGDNFGTGQATISNLKGTQGLFASIAPTANVKIEGLKFSGTNAISNNVSTGLGLLAGFIKATTKDLTLSKITVEGVTITTGAGGKYKNIGGLVGIVNDDVNVINCNVTASLQAYANMGGFFGQIAAGTVNFQAATAAGAAVDPTANNSYATTNTYNAANATFTLNKDATDFSTNYATEGQLAGNIVSGATVTVALKTMPTYTEFTGNTETAESGLAKWVERDAEGDPIRYRIIMMQDMFGFSGIAGDGALTNVATKSFTNDVTVYGSETNDANHKYQTRTYTVKATKIVAGDAGTYYLNVINK